MAIVTNLTVNCIGRPLDDSVTFVPVAVPFRLDRRPQSVPAFALSEWVGRGKRSSRTRRV